jgi:hypothetical protein
MGYATKAEWAAAKAAGIRQQIDHLSAERLPSSQWARIRRREEVLSDLRREEAHFRQLATRLQASNR